VAQVDIYVRVSRVGGRENLISPAEQERRGRELAAAQKLKVGEVIIDLDESGGKWDRPGLQKALARVEGGQSSGVIVAWLDRLSRDSEHAHALVRRITDAGGKIYAPDAPADWTTPEGGLQAGILFEFAAYVRKRAGAGFERAKERAIEHGIPVANRVAVGYRRRGDRRLEPDPVAAPVVAEVFAARLRGAGPIELAAILEDAGITTSQGSRTWSKPAIYGMLRNRIYLGELSYGKDRRFVNTESHEPIVDVATWQLAQRKNVGVVHARAHLLSGLIRCDGCRHCLQGTIDGHRHRIYRCGRRHAGGVCPRPARIRAERVEDAVLADMWKHIWKLDADGQKDARGRLSDLAKDAERERLALAQWASPEMQQEIGALDIYAAGMRERRQRVTAADEALAAERARQNAAHAFPANVSEWQAVWEQRTIAEQAAMVATQYDCLRLSRNPDLLIVYPDGLGPPDLPRRGFQRDVSLRPFEPDRPDGSRVIRL